MQDTDRIRELNDAFRAKPTGGRLLLTRGIAGRADSTAIVARVTAYDTFEPGNDPYQEHDFGAFEHGSDTIFWKIDYYDRDLRYASPDPADPAVTTRTLTIMLAEEY